MSSYNFMTSYGFVATSTITSSKHNSSGTQTYQEQKFSVLNKYQLPSYTIYVRDSYISLYSETTKLFGFTRGSDTWEYRFGVNRMTAQSNGYYRYLINLVLFKNGVYSTAISTYTTTQYEVQYSALQDRPFTHFYICQPTSTSNYNNFNFLVYDYTTAQINIHGSNTATPKGGFMIGFCNSGYGLNNSYNNTYPNPSSNGVRNVNYILLTTTGNVNNLTNISDYTTLIEWVCGKNVKYVGDDDVSVPGGGYGTGDNSTDNNPIPDTTDTTDFEATNVIMNASGLFTTHIMDSTAITNLVSKLWDNSITTALERLLGSKPLDVIISLKRLPLTLTSATTKNIYLGTTDTEINTPIVTSQYVTVNCGTLYPKEYWGNALDYSPSTKYFIYLPFIGIKSINVDWFQDKEISIKYIIDVLSGDFTCFLQQGETTDTFHQNVVATYTGNCAMQYPLSASDYSSMFIGGMSVLKGAAAGAVFGGSAGAVLGAATSAANTITMKPSYDMTGVYNANMGFCGIMKPYIIIERPIQSLPAQVEYYVGFPSNRVSTLSSLTGFTKVQDINLSVNCTLDEKNEIENLLKRGVII